MWFQKLTGFAEESPNQVRANLTLDGNTLTSRVNGKTWVCGDLETPSLAELRQRVQLLEKSPSAGPTMSVSEVVANVQRLHTSPSHAGALFQVASQFNLLEMTSPKVIPEAGVGIYEHDRTQGPACAIAAGAGTIYRNYFVPVNGQTGQSANHQMDCLADLGVALGNATEGELWRMTNGYALASESGLLAISQRLQEASEPERDDLRQLLRIGIQWQTQVTLNEDSQHLVSQAYCSALPVAYSNHSSSLWMDFACLVLEASYEATICAAILNAAQTGNKKVFLTLLGGGAFGNDVAWIMAAIRRALTLYQDFDLDVAIVSYGYSQPEVRDLVQEMDGSYATSSWVT